MWGNYGIKKCHTKRNLKFINYLKIKKGYMMWNCNFCELQSEKNIAEVEGVVISVYTWRFKKF